ncbi:RING finger protein 8 [Favolaschia claudopus]|uniref:RING finger protein 8 n=1 Tax=Favolaschia claudopus TaxID=2862362 RepID=A0AAW0EHS1_9AGAR
MHITFSPALGETVQVSTGWTKRPATRLHFSATLSTPADSEVFARGRAKLQVWSDIPTGGGRNAGDWGEAEFMLVPPLPSDENEFSLFPTDCDGERKLTTLTVDLPVPASNNEQRFSFTYRLVHSNGEIEWLGSYGQNGTLILNHDDAVVLNKDWTADGDLHCYNSNGHAVQGVEVARLSRPSDYIQYPISDQRDSSLIVLVPRPLCHPALLPPTLVFGATASGSIAFNPRGAITISGNPSLLFASLESSDEIDPAAANIFDSCSSSRTRVLSYIPGVLVLATAVAAKSPVQVSIIPIASSASVLRSVLNVQSLASVLSLDSPFFLFSPVRGAARFIEERLDENISFTASQSGGHFLVCPAHSVGPTHDRWWVGITSPHSLSAHAEALPTPPPSPRLRPLPHRSSEVLMQSPDPSYLNLPAAISSQRSASPSSSHLVLRASSERRGLIALIGRIFMFIFGLIGRLFGWNQQLTTPQKRISDERTPLLQEPLEEDVPTDHTDSDRPKPSIDQASASSLLVDVGRGHTTILFQADYPVTSCSVPIQLNGHDVDLDVQALSDRLFLVEFASISGGSLRIC